MRWIVVAKGRDYDYEYDIRLRAVNGQRPLTVTDILLSTVSPAPGRLNQLDARLESPS